MRKAETTHTTTRRTLLGVALALPAVAAVPAVAHAAARSPDAEFIRLCDRLVALAVEQRALCLAHPFAPDHGPHHARHEALCAEHDAIEGRLYDIGGPTTHQGVRAAARAALAEADKDFAGNIETRHIGDFLAISVAEALVGGAA
jgi:hypothetical protein